MSNAQKHTAAVLLAIGFLFTTSASSWAIPIVNATIDSLDGGVFRYNLTLTNTGGLEPLGGLFLVNAGSVFGLDDSSVIDAPQDVGGDPIADVPIDGSIGGFSFLSAKDPATIMGNDFAVEAIGASSASEIPLGNAQVVPAPVAEPASLVLLAIGLGG